MGIKQLYNDNLWKLPNEYGDVSVIITETAPYSFGSLFHYTQHLDEVGPEHLDCDIKLTIYKLCKKKKYVLISYNCY